MAAPTRTLKPTPNIVTIQGPDVAVGVVLQPTIESPDIPPVDCSQVRSVKFGWMMSQECQDGQPSFGYHSVIMPNPINLSRDLVIYNNGNYSSTNGACDLETYVPVSQWLTEDLLLPSRIPIGIHVLWNQVGAKPVVEWLIHKNESGQYLADLKVIGNSLLLTYTYGGPGVINIDLILDGVAYPHTLTLANGP